MKRAVIIVLLTASSNGFAQIDSTQVKSKEWMLYPGKEQKKDTLLSAPDKQLSSFEGIDDSTAYFDPNKDLDFNSGKTGKITVSKDGRMDQLMEFLSSGQDEQSVKIDGYRIQLYFDQDRNKVLGEKTRFLSMTKKTRAYMEWDAPNHYVRVGNFYTKQQALAYLESLDGAFPSATVTKSKIDLPEFE